jgi:lysophospholipase L1-like esterase
VGLVRRVFRASFDHVERYAQEWSASNSEALSSTGPLWVVLGDSAAQGVGASSYDRGWVGQVRQRLEERDGVRWRVLNLSRSGARTRDVLTEQLPRVVDADLVTAVVGGNDALHTRRDRWLRDADELVGSLPSGAVVSTVARGVFERKTRVVNAHLRTAAAARGLRVADLWAHTGPPYRGLYFDGLHPNDAGYRQWADAVWAVL